MRNTPRIRIAAAVLLSPLAVLVAQPAAAEPDAIAGRIGFSSPSVAAPLIDRFVARPDGRIEPGHDIRFVLFGAPGARAWMDIPGIASGIPLREVRAGVYEAGYMVRRRDDPGAFAHAVATVQRGGLRSSLQVDLRGGYIPRDNRAPQITEVSPAQGERIGEWRRTRVTVRFFDDGSGVDPASVRLLMDGRDVTAQTRVDGDSVHLRADLGGGRHTAEVMVRDRAGNLARRAWSFDVLDHGRHGGWDHRGDHHWDYRGNDRWGHRWGVQADNGDRNP